MIDGCLGEVRLFAGNFAPRDWAICNGQLLAISNNSALFSILGTIYGGDGQTTFALPDMRGRVVVGTGTGPGLSPKQLGVKSGFELNYLNIGNLPPHNHTSSFKVSTQDGEESNPSGQYLAKNENAELYLDTSNATMAADCVEINNTGSGIGVNNMQPFIAINYVICLLGLYPSRS